MADPKINTQFVFPPIPDRRWDWSATFDGYDGAEDSSTRHHIGYGRTEAEAIADLVESYGENSDG